MNSATIGQQMTANKKLTFDETEKRLTDLKRLLEKKLISKKDYQKKLDAILAQF